jgi:DNA replication protein DnaC
MELLKNLMEANMQSSSNIELQKDEYIKDDVIYCKKCNTPRTTVIEVFDVKKKVRCICKCQAKERDEKARIEKEIEKQMKIARLQDASLLGERYRHVTFENTVTGKNKSFDEAFKRCKRYCEVADDVLKEGYGIYIWGDKGTGKTHLTSCMANELIRQYKQVLFTNFFEISKSIRATFGGKGNESDLINKIANIDFLFIDDLGTEKVSNNGEDNWLQGQIFDVINKRYNNNKPTIFTSNYSLPTIIEERGLMDKTADRIMEMSTAILKIEGRSNRAQRRENTLF